MESACTDALAPQCGCNRVARLPLAAVNDTLNSPCFIFAYAGISFQIVPVHAGDEFGYVFYFGVVAVFNIAYLVE